MRLRKILNFVSLLLLGVWLGAAVFFSASVAPNVFAVLRGADVANASTLAGSIVTRLLTTLNRGGFEIALFLLVTSYFATRNQKRWTRWAEVISLAIMAIMTGIGHWVISGRMAALRTAMQAPVEQIAPDDPRRIAFDSLHRYSVMAMGVAIVAALVSFVLVSNRKSRSTSEPSALASSPSTDE